MRRYDSVRSRRHCSGVWPAPGALSYAVIHRLAHRCEIFWTESRVQPYSQSKVTAGRERISRVPGGHSLR